MRFPIGDPLQSSFSWNPQGSLLAVNDGHKVLMVNPATRQIMHFGRQPGYCAGWRPDGKALLIADDAKHENFLLDVHSGKRLRTFPPHWRIWWLGSTLCHSEDVDFLQRKPSDVQTWWVGGSARKLPKGLTIN